MSRSKPLSIREAQEIATHTIGPRGGAYIRNYRGNREYIIVEIVAVGDAREHGVSTSSFRQAFHDAGIFWEE